MISEIRNRLDTTGTPFRLIAGAVALAQVKDRPPTLPAAFVFPIRDAASENERMTGPVLQRIASDIAVLIVFESLTAPIGDQAADELESMVDWVRARLIGFQPGDDAEPLEHVSGELVKAISGAIWWQETFGTASYRQEEP